MENKEAIPASQRILIYVAGSCIGNPGVGGWAATLRRYEGDREVKFAALSGSDPDTDNIKMELKAAIAALHCLRQDDTSPITICTDSEHVTKGLPEWIDGWVARGWMTSKGKPVANRGDWLELARLTEGRDVTWQWINSRSADPFNADVKETALGAARRAGLFGRQGS